MSVCDKFNILRVENHVVREITYITFLHLFKYYKCFTRNCRLYVLTVAKDGSDIKIFTWQLEVVKITVVFRIVSNRICCCFGHFKAGLLRFCCQNCYLTIDSCQSDGQLLDCFRQFFSLITLGFDCWQLSKDLSIPQFSFFKYEQKGWF